MYFSSCLLEAKAKGKAKAKAGGGRHGFGRNTYLQLGCILPTYIYIYFLDGVSLRNKLTPKR